MKKIFEKNYKNIYFMGIGGVSMSAIAQLLNNFGYNVSGSDSNYSKVILELEEKGIKINIGHNAENITKNIDLLVYNAAIKPDNIEFARAVELGIDIMGRAEVLGLCMKAFENPICIAGSHGKTTTTSLISEIFMQNGKSPTIMNGANLPSINSTFSQGLFDYFIAESCEYNNSFLSFFPKVGIILNIDMDHNDFFKDITEIRESFKKFAKLIPSDGLLIINENIPNKDEIIEGLDCKVLTFGENGNICAKNIKFNELGQACFWVEYNGKRQEINLSIPGVHNVENALAAVLTGLHFGIELADIARVLGDFSPPARRFDYAGEYNGAKIIDDYAHHPNEVLATIKSVKNMQINRLFVAFQPHTNSRTALFLDDFAKSLSLADQVIVLDIYAPSGRADDEYKVHSLELCKKIENCKYFENFEQAKNYLQKSLEPNDMLITMGAGDVYKLAELVVL